MLLLITIGMYYVTYRYIHIGKSIYLRAIAAVHLLLKDKCVRVGVTNYKKIEGCVTKRDHCNKLIP